MLMWLIGRENTGSDKEPILLSKSLTALNDLASLTINDLKKYEDKLTPKLKGVFNFKIMCLNEEELFEIEKTHFEGFSGNINLAENTIFINSEKSFEHRMLSVIYASYSVYSNKFISPKKPKKESTLDILKYKRDWSQHEVDTYRHVQNVYERFLENTGIVKPEEPIKLKCRSILKR